MKVAIPHANGQLIRCPLCGETSLVRPAKIPVGLRNAEVANPFGWYLVDCPKTGKKLYPHTQVVEVIEASHVGSGGRQA